MVGVLLAVLALTVQGIVFLFAFLAKIGVNLNPFEWGEDASATNRERNIHLLRDGLPYQVKDVERRASNIFASENAELLADLEHDLRYIYADDYECVCRKHAHLIDFTAYLMIAKYYDSLATPLTKDILLPPKVNSEYLWNHTTVCSLSSSHCCHPDNPKCAWIILRYLQRIEYYMNKCGKGDLCRFVSKYGSSLVSLPITSSINGLSKIVEGEVRAIGTITLEILVSPNVGCSNLARPYTDFETDPRYEYVKRDIQMRNDSALEMFLPCKCEIFMYTEDFMKSEERNEACKAPLITQQKHEEEERYRKAEERQKERRKEEREKLFLISLVVVLIMVIYLSVVWG